MKVALGAGSTFVAYTDGLIERRTESIDIGIDVSRALSGATFARCRRARGKLLEDAGGSATDDDVAVLVVKLVSVPDRARHPVPGRGAGASGWRGCAAG